MEKEKKRKKEKERIESEARENTERGIFFFSFKVKENRKEKVVFAHPVDARHMYCVQTSNRTMPTLQQNPGLPRL